MKKPYCLECDFEDEDCEVRRSIYQRVCVRRLLSEAQRYPYAHGKPVIHVSTQGERVESYGHPIDPNEHMK